MSPDRHWTGPTRPASPGWRAAILERVDDVERRSLVEIVAWGEPERYDLVPLGVGGVRLDGPGLLAAEGPHVTDAEVWERIRRSREVAAEIDERMRRDCE